MYDFLLHVLVMTGIYAMIALALNIQSGWTGMLNFGHIAFVGIGAYTVGIANLWQLPLYICMAGGFALTILLALIMANLGKQLASDYWGIATLAIAEIVRMVMLNEDELTGGAQGISNLAIQGINTSANHFIFLVAFALLATVILCRRIYLSRFGRSLRLLREEPKLAMCLGYNIQSLKSQSLIISAVISAFAGMLLALYTNYVSPDYLLSSETFVIWSMLMIGGIGRISGVLLGTLVMELLYNFIPFAKDIFTISSDMSGALRLGLVGLILLISLMKKSDGLLPEKLRSL